MARADLHLEIGTLSEGVTVSGEAPLLDTSTALQQTVISRDVLEALPNRTDVWSIARVIPGVVMSKVDVGGTEQFLQSSASVRGRAWTRPRGGRCRRSSWVRRSPWASSSS